MILIAGFLAFETDKAKPRAYPIDWEDRERFSYFAGFVKGVAWRLNIRVRWGGDWDGDTELSDNNFDDLVHFELK